MKGMYSRQLLQLPSPHSDHRRGKTFGSSDDRNATKNNVVATSRSELPALRKLEQVSTPSGITDYHGDSRS